MSASAPLVLCILQQPSEVFYYAHGGKKSGITVRVGLFSSSSSSTSSSSSSASHQKQSTLKKVRDPSICLPLTARLLYTSGAPALSLKTNRELLRVIDSSPIDGSGEGFIKFRLEEVSSLHRHIGGDGGKFVLEVSTQSEHPDFGVTLSQCTTAFTTRSKLPKRKQADDDSSDDEIDADAAAAAICRRRRSNSDNSHCESGHPVTKRRSRGRASSDTSPSASSARALASSASNHISSPSQRPSTAPCQRRASSSSSPPMGINLPLEVLRKMEWVSIGAGLVCCPCCKAVGSQHNQGCELSAAILAATETTTSTTQETADDTTNGVDLDDDNFDLDDAEDLDMTIDFLDCDDRLPFEATPPATNDCNSLNSLDTAPTGHHNIISEANTTTTTTCMDFWMVGDKMECRALPLVKAAAAATDRLVHTTPPCSITNSNHNNNNPASLFTITLDNDDLDPQQTTTVTKTTAKYDYDFIDDYHFPDDQNNSFGSMFNEFAAADLQTAAY